MTSPETIQQNRIAAWTSEDPTRLQKALNGLKRLRSAVGSSPKIEKMVVYLGRELERLR